jgi:predicted dehydrogenase
MKKSCDSEPNLPRRDLFKAAAAAAAFPYVIRASALGREGGAAAGERVTLGHIGVGNRGGSLLGSFLQLPQARSVAVCDAKKDMLEAAARRIDGHYGGKSCQKYGDFRQLLAREDIDAVVVATADHWHVPIAIAAARAGKDMYVEKPLGISVEQDQALRKEILRRRLVFQYGTQQRSGRDFRLACRIARSGRLGKVHTIHAWCNRGERGGSAEPEPVPDNIDYEMWLGPAPHRPYSGDRCGGIDARKGIYHISDYALGFIAGWGAHPLDIAQWGNDTELAAPVQYEGTGEFPGEGLFDTAVQWDVTCRYANGVVMRFMSQDIAEPVVSSYRKWHRHGTTFIGETGWVSVDRAGICAKPESLLRGTFGPNDVYLYESDNHSQNFVDCVKSRRRTASPIEPAVQSDIISHLSDIAIRTGRKIRWDSAAEKIIGDDQAARMLKRAMRKPWSL